jgi:hypothetical protein
VVLVRDGVPLSARDQPAVRRERNGAGDQKGEARGCPRRRVARPGLHRAWDQQHDRVATISMIVMLIVSAASAIGRTATSASCQGRRIRGAGRGGCNDAFHLAAAGPKGRLLA